MDGDGPEGVGPLLDYIAEAAKALSAALDSSDAVGNAAYTLEVSSRGVSRPLLRPEHWRRNVGAWWRSASRAAKASPDGSFARTPTRWNSRSTDPGAN